MRTRRNPETGHVVNALGESRPIQDYVPGGHPPHHANVCPFCHSVSVKAGSDKCDNPACSASPWANAEKILAEREAYARRMAEEESRKRSVAAWAGVEQKRRGEREARQAGLLAECDRRGACRVCLVHSAEFASEFSSRPVKFTKHREACPRERGRARNPHHALDRDSREHLERGPGRDILNYGAGVADAAERAVRAGAVPPLHYLGTGMTAHVFTDAPGRAYKVSTSVNDHRREAFAREAAWLRSAGRSKATRDQVATLYHYDPDNLVIVREHVKGIAHGRHPKSGEWLEEVAQKRFAALEAPLLRRGWTVPEQKPESWRFSEEDPSKGKLFDAGMAWEVGRRLVAKVLRFLKRAEAAEKIRDREERILALGALVNEATDLMRDVRNEATHWKSPTIRLDVARKLLDALARAGGDPTLARDLVLPRTQNPKKGAYKLRCQHCNVERRSLPCPTWGHYVCGRCAKPRCRECLRQEFDNARHGHEPSQRALAAYFQREEPEKIFGPPPAPPLSRVHDAHGRPYWSSPDVAPSPTFQYRMSHATTDAALRPPAGLMVSDMGTHMVPQEAIPAMPPGVFAYQVVDAHHNYADAERWLFAHGFGCARSWHYEALGLKDAHQDGEGHLVHRYLRLFRRGPERGQLISWDGEGPTTGPGFRPSWAPKRPPGQTTLWKENGVRRRNTDAEARALERRAVEGDINAASRLCALARRSGDRELWARAIGLLCALEEPGASIPPPYVPPPSRSNPWPSEGELSVGDWRSKRAPQTSTLRVLGALAHHETVLTLPQLVQESGLSIATVRRAVQELVARRYAEPAREGVKVTHHGVEAREAFERVAAEEQGAELDARDFERMEAQALRARGVRAYHPMTLGPTGERARTMFRPHPAASPQHVCKSCKRGHTPGEHRGHRVDSTSYKVGLVGQQYENPKGVPEGMKLRKGSNFSSDGEWLVTYLGVTVPVFHDKGGSGWFRTDIPGWYGTGSAEFFRARLGDNREEALLNLARQLEAKSPRRPNHPALAQAVSVEIFLGEFRALWRASRLRGQPRVTLSDRLDRRHQRCERSYAEVDVASRHFFFANAVLRLPRANRLGLLAHEVGHVLAPSGSEADADAAARRVLKVDVMYDPRWKGRAPSDGQCGLQVGRRVR